jgi:hypothetical protein
MSTPETGLEHMNDSVLPCDHLSLPHENDRHHAHRENTKGQNDTGLCFRCWYVEHSPKNFHKGRPPKGNCRVTPNEKKSPVITKLGQLRNHKSSQVIEPSVPHL